MLSFPYNKNEKLNKRHKVNRKFEHKKAKKLQNHSRKNYKKTHKIFSKETMNIILQKKLKNFLQYSFIQKMFFVHNRFFEIFTLLK